MSKLRVLARYWFIAPLLLVVVGLQLGIGFIIITAAVNNGDAEASPVSLLSAVSPDSRASVPTRVSTSLPALGPTLAPSPTRTPRPTFTPSPTRTPTASPTPTGTLTPTATPSPTSTPTVTSTPTPQPTPLIEDFTVQAPILMYHHISVAPPGADAVRRDLSVTPAQFEAHLAYLRQAGFQTISMNQLAHALSRQTPLPLRPIILTFDDGYRDNYENAFPLLRQYGYTGTFFIFTQVIDTYNVDYLTWEMVIEMHKAGMEFGSHSYRHPDLRGKGVDFLVYEILGSKEAIEERIGEPVRFFSYPAGHYDDLTIRVLASANFWGAVTTQYGFQQSYNQRFELHRLRIRGSDTAEDLAEKLD